MPAVVNWKVGHYAALIAEENGLYHLQDPTFGNDTWTSRRALEAESSGYFLVPAGKLPKGWRKFRRRKETGFLAKAAHRPAIRIPPPARIPARIVLPILCPTLESAAWLCRMCISWW
jgi:hypothetical protein